MIDLGPPPVREPIISASIDKTKQTVKIDSMSSIWIAWFSKLIVAVETNAVVSGSTANRPVNQTKGFLYFDTTLGRPIWWNASVWVDATGTPV